MGPKNTWNALQITLVLNSLLNGICHLILQHLSCLSFNDNQTSSARTEMWDRESDVCPRRARNRADGRRAPKCRADQNEGLVRMPKILCCESLRICSVKSSQLMDKRWKSRWHWLHQLSRLWVQRLRLELRRTTIHTGYENEAWAQNGITCAKPHDRKPSLVHQLITVRPLGEMYLLTRQPGMTWSALARSSRPLPLPWGGRPCLKCVLC